MSRVEDVEAKFLEPNSYFCSICGESADVMWSGKRQIAFCDRCATDILPRIIADVDQDNPEITWEKATYFYWRALSKKKRIKVLNQEVSK